MSSGSGTTAPAAGNGANPACAPTLPCQNKKCWPDDYDKEIAANPPGRYYKKFASDGTTNVPLNISVSYKIIVPVKSATTITVEVRFKAAPDSGVSDADVASAKSKLQDGIDKNWNKKFKLTASDTECPSKTFDIVFKPVFVTSGEHYTMKIHKTYAREGLTGPDLDVSKTTTAWTYAHEFGHTFGLPDEYSYSQTETQQVKYIKPDGTLDTAISAPPGGKATSATDATIMAAVDNTTVLPRHAWNIAIEVQDLLTQKIGRPIKCSIQ